MPYHTDSVNKASSVTLQCLDKAFTYFVNCNMVRIIKIYPDITTRGVPEISGKGQQVYFCSTDFIKIHGHYMH